MFEIIFLGLTTALGALVLIALAPIRKQRMLGYCWAFDVVFSVGIILTYAGSFAGIATAFVAGLTFSGLTRLARWWLGSEHFDFRTWAWEPDGGS